MTVWLIRMNLLISFLFSKKNFIKSWTGPSLYLRRTSAIWWASFSLGDDDSVIDSLFLLFGSYCLLISSIDCSVTWTWFWVFFSRSRRLCLPLFLLIENWFIPGSKSRSAFGGPDLAGAWSLSPTAFLFSLAAAGSCCSYCCSSDSNFKSYSESVKMSCMMSLNSSLKRYAYKAGVGVLYLTAPSPSSMSIFWSFFPFFALSGSIFSA